MEYMQVNRANGRAANELRPVKLTRGVMSTPTARAWRSLAIRACCALQPSRRACPGLAQGRKAGG